MSRDQSIRKSLIEASRNLLTYREEPITFREAIKSNPDLWCANASYIEGFFDLFESKSTSSCRPDFDSKTELFNLQDFPSLHGCPVFAVRSTLHDRCV
jgi:hypothetical protein